MVPKFANPHSLSQDVELTTRSEIAERAGLSSTVHDVDTTLKRGLDTFLQDTWANAFTRTSDLPRSKKPRNVCENGDDPLAFRLLSSMKHPQHISLDPKPPPRPVLREPECEDDKAQAETRKIRSLSAAVVFDVIMGGDTVSTGRIDRKAVGAKMQVTDTDSVNPLPPLLVTEEARVRRIVRRVRNRDVQADKSLSASPHEPRLSCTVLPVMTVPDRKESIGKKRRKSVRERPPPAYWRPSSGLRGQCMGYGLGYPSNWASDRRYVRDTMKKGVASNPTCHAVHEDPH